MLSYRQAIESEKKSVNPVKHIPNNRPARLLFLRALA
jgi:hypothetical protein